jgi:tRNA (mo5U34)-methyltransferase
MAEPALASEVERLSWYHTLDLGGGVVTRGMFDHRTVVDRCLLPDDLSGMRCLDVGTMDGFWGFELERRGAEEVVATDVADPDELDWPPRWRERIDPVLDAGKEERFELAHSALGSRVQRVVRSVYELDTALGQFDLVFCGDLLTHLKDPITAIQRIHGVCRGSAIIFNPISRFRLAKLFRRRPLPAYNRRPLAEFDGIDEFQWWLLSEEAIERMIWAVGFERVEVGPRFSLPPTTGHPWKGLRAVMRGFV